MQKIITQCSIVINQNLSADIKELLKLMLIKNHENRASVNELMNHSLVK